MRKTHDERRREIVRKAEKIIASSGIESLTMNRLAHEVGITDAAIYRHFKSKEDILAAVLDDFSAPLQMVQKTIIDSPRPVLERLGDIFVEKSVRLFRHPEQTLIMRSLVEFRGNRRLSQDAARMIGRYRTRMLSLIREGQRRGEIISSVGASHLYFLIVGSLHLLVQEWAVNRRAFDLQRQAKSLWKSLKVILTSSTT